MRLIVSSFVFASLLASTSAFAGYVIEQKVTQSGEGVPSGDKTTTLSFEGIRMRTDMGTTMSTIIDFGVDKIFMVQHDKKEYSELTLDKFMEQMKQSMDAMKAKLAGLPPEKRQALESLFSDQPTSLEASPEDSTVAIAGLSAKKYDVTRGGKAIGELWLTRDLDLGKLAGSLEKFSKSMKSALAGMGGMANLAMPAGLDVEKGFPLRSVTNLEMMGRKVTATTETTKVEKKSVPGAKFKVPANYKKVDMQSLMPQRPGPAGPGAPPGGGPGH